MVLTTNKKSKNMKKTFFVLGLTCEPNIKETNNENIVVTRIDDYANFERRLTSIETIFFIGIGNGKNRGKFDNGTDEVSGSNSDFGSAGNRIAAEVQFHYSRKRIVPSQSSWLHNTNKIAGFEVSIGR